VKVVILDSAKEHLIEGFSFYEPQNPGLGSYFLDSLFADIDSLTIYAGIHPFSNGYQRCLSRRFPFAIYYLIQGAEPAQQVVAGRLWGITKPAVLRKLESCLGIRLVAAACAASFELQMPDWP